MPIHPQIAAFLVTLPSEPGPVPVPDPAAARAAEAAHLPPLADRLPLHAVEDLTAGDVPVRVYTPVEDASGVVVYLHGGAFFSGSLDTHDGIARGLAAATGCRVVSAGYRLAPEHAFPAGLDDSAAVLRWAAGRYGRAGEPLAVAGDSSGGTFAAAVAALVHDDGSVALTHQVLLYPSLDLDFDESRYPSLAENATGFGLETRALRPHNSHYLEHADPADPLVSPIKRADLAGLPAALVITAEFDPLRDEGEDYADRLAEAGVPVTQHRYAGAGHGFVQFFSWLPEYAGVFDEVAAFLGRGPAVRA